jgi:hypothetical protein
MTRPRRPASSRRLQSRAPEPHREHRTTLPNDESPAAKARTYRHDCACQARAGTPSSSVRSTATRGSEPPRCAASEAVVLAIASGRNGASRIAWTLRHRAVSGVKVGHRRERRGAEDRCISDAPGARQRGILGRALSARWIGHSPRDALAPRIGHAGLDDARASSGPPRERRLLDAVAPVRDGDLEPKGPPRDDPHRGLLEAAMTGANWRSSVSDRAASLLVSTGRAPRRSPRRPRRDRWCAR